MRYHLLLLVTMERFQSQGLLPCYRTPGQLDISLIGENVSSGDSDGVERE